MAAIKKQLDPIPPGEILLEEFLKPLGVSQQRLARDIGSVCEQARSKYERAVDPSIPPVISRR